MEDLRERRRGNGDVRQPGRDRPDDRDPMRREVESPRERDRGHDHDECRWERRDEALQHEQHDERARCESRRRAADTAELADHLPQLPKRMTRGDREAEELPEWPMMRTIATPWMYPISTGREK